MVFVRRTLAIVALTTTLVSCSSPELPATSDTLVKEKIRIYSTTSVQPLAMDLATLQELEEWQVVGIDMGNHDQLLDRLISNEDGVMLTTTYSAVDGLWAAPVARDGIAIIINLDVELDNLSTEQLRAIYQGRISNWEQVGGNSQEVVIVSREVGSGTRQEFEAMVMGSRLITAGAMVVTSSQQMLNRVAETPGAIGYVSFGLVSDAVQLVALDGVVPDEMTISEQIYPLRTTIYLLGISEQMTKNQGFLNWLQSAAGQKIISQHYVPINVPQGMSD